MGFSCDFLMCPFMYGDSKQFYLNYGSMFFSWIFRRCCNQRMYPSINDHQFNHSTAYRLHGLTLHHKVPRPQFEIQVGKRLEANMCFSGSKSAISTSEWADLEIELLSNVDRLQIIQAATKCVETAKKHLPQSCYLSIITLTLW